jgi:hypothetical protein
VTSFRRWTEFHPLAELVAFVFPVAVRSKLAAQNQNEGVVEHSGGRTARRQHRRCAAPGVGDRIVHVVSASLVDSRAESASNNVNLAFCRDHGKMTPGERQRSPLAPGVGSRIADRVHVHRFSIGAAASDHVNLAINDGRADACATADKPSAKNMQRPARTLSRTNHNRGCSGLKKTVLVCGLSVSAGGGFVSRTVLTASRCACRLGPGNRKCGAPCGTSEPVPRLRRGDTFATMPPPQRYAQPCLAAGVVALFILPVQVETGDFVRRLFRRALRDYNKKLT